jgi:microcystin-dependent protein
MSSRIIALGLAAILLPAFVFAQGKAGTSLDDLRNAVKEQATALAAAQQALVTLVPAGTVISFAPPVGQRAPDGWLLCDGREVSAAQYPKLCQALGNTYGSARAGGMCKLPNYSGRFMRGVDVTGLFPDAAPTTVGKEQDYATALPSKGFQIAGGPHTHGINMETTASRDHKGNANNTVAFPFVGPRRAQTDTDGAHSHSLEGGDNETWPRSISVFYLIRAY